MVEWQDGGYLEDNLPTLKKQLRHTLQQLKGYIFF